jgi:hypothetical protein
LAAVIGVRGGGCLGRWLPIDEEAEPIGVRHLGCLRIVLQFDECVGHGSEAE